MFQTHTCCRIIGNMRREPGHKFFHSFILFCGASTVLSGPSGQLKQQQKKKNQINSKKKKNEFYEKQI